jgi:hypothetical protein
VFHVFCAIAQSERMLIGKRVNEMFRATATHRKSQRTMARLKGLEPLTLGSEDRCSVQLSYRRASHSKISRIARNFLWPWGDAE